MSHIDHERLNHLWNHRSQLDAREWEELYEVIGRILGRGDYLLRLTGVTCNETRDSYIHEFFTEVVYMRAITRSEPTGHQDTSCTSAYIRTAFRNFLKDRVRYNKKFAADRLQDREVGDEDREITEDVSVALHEASAEKQVTAKGEDLPDEEDVSDDDETPDEFIPCLRNRAILEENGLNRKQVESSAIAWLNRQENWVLLYLGLHLCPEKEERMAADFLSERYAIRSYHYKLRRLGISRTKKEPDIEWFRPTMLGQWIETDLKVSIEPDNSELVKSILMILCDVSLERVDLLQN
jgi:hypothetical protein